MFDALPEAFGSHRVLEAIEEGRFGPVYRAREDATGLDLAVKVFDQGLTAEQAARLAEALERLRDAPLNHPSIVPILSAGVEQEHAWAAEPWFEAVPLDAVMRRDGAQPFADVLMRVAQIAGALDFAAAAGLHHGALHPRDILISGEETAVVGIGLLQALGDAGLVVPMEGAYVSPQRARGTSVTGPDDIFSLAAITYELAYGVAVPPRSELRTTATPPAGIDHARLAELLERALSPDVEARPSTALAFAESIQAVRVPVPDFEPSAPIQFEPSAPIQVAAPPLPIRDPEPPVVDLPLRAADVEAAPFHEDRNRGQIGVRVDSDPDPTPIAPTVEREPEFVPLARHREPEREPEPGYWLPVSATLAIGLLMGFASGYVVGQRERIPTPYAAERAVARGQQPGRSEGPPVSTSGRDFTESVVPQPVTEPPVRPPNEGTDRATGSEPRERSGAPAPDEPGVLQVDSRPRGARVFIDGRLVGMTPVVVDDVKPGAHAIRIDLRGHRRWVTSVEVAPGERQRVAASLER